MDSEAVESSQDVDFNDSDTNGTLFKKDTVRSEIRWEEDEKRPLPCSSVSSSSSSSSSSVSGGQASRSSLPAPPDGGWGWVVVFASFMINFIADGVSLSFGILFVDFVDYFDSSKAKTSWVGSIFLSMPLLAGPVASYLIDRYGCQRMCILGALLSTVSFIVSIFADSLELLFLTFTVAGLGLALCYVTSIVIVAYYFEKKRSLATGLAACGTGIGTFVFPPFTIYLLERYDWQGTLLILSGFFLNMMVFGALMRDLESPSKEPTNPAKHSPDHSDGCTLEDSERLCSSLVQLPTYLRDNLPVEVISELSSKEGGYLNSLLEHHPFLFGSIIPKEAAISNASSVAAIPQDFMKKEKKSKPKSGGSGHRKNSNTLKPPPTTISRHPSFTTKIDAAYLRNMRVQRGSITYRGAMLNIHRYRLRASSCPDIYRNSMVTIAEEKTCLWLSELMLEMFDFTNFKNLGYTLFCLSNFLLYACVDVPYVYVPDHAHTTGTNMESASFLISILGVLNCLGVVIVGYIGDKPWIDPSLLYSGFILLSGVSLALIPLVASYYITATLVGVYGFTISANYTLVPVIIVNLISLDNFTGAYGLLLLVQGIASLIGPPLAGMFFDMTGNYDITFYSTGLFIIVSGAMVIPVAKTVTCRRSSMNNNSKDPLPLCSSSSKVKLQEPKEKEVSIDFTPVKGDVKFVKDKRTMYDAKEEADNSVPLLSGDNKTPDDVDKTEDDKLVTMYENPLSLV